MKLSFYIIGLTMSLCFSSCTGEKKKHLAFYDTEEVTEDIIAGETNLDSPLDVSYGSSSDVEVPFVESNGVKLIDVTVNRQFTVKMILDSGCSSTLISIAEAK